MEKMIQRILVTFALGFLLTGAILGFVSVADCGSVFSPGDGCAATLSTQRALVIAFIGLGLTAGAAWMVADIAKPAGEPEHPEHQD